MIEWLITNGHIITILMVLLCIFFGVTIYNASEPSNPVMTLIFCIASVVTFVTLITAGILIKTIPESTATWTQIYTNDADASVAIDYGENHTVTAGNLLGIYGRANLNNSTDKLATVIIKNGGDESRRKVMVHHIEGDINENSAITKIEYRPTPTMHYQLFGVDAHSQTSYFDGEIRITVSKQTNSANTIFGD